MLKFILPLGAFLCCLAGFGQSTVSGRVFVDQNNNGKPDKREKGLPGVAVSNGKEVSVTDQNGRYELPVTKDQIIFVIKPAGYQFKNDSYNLPQSYHIHKPNGTPQSFRYKGVAPTKPLPKSLNFALYQKEEPSDFSVLLFGDPQPYTRQELDYFAKGIVQDIKVQDNVKFGISLGDIVGDDLDLHLPYKEIMSKLNLTWYNVMGNHDMNYEATSDSLSDETFEKNFGPNNFSWNYGNAHFIILDDILYPHPVKKKGYWGGFRADQLEFIKNDLALVDKNKLIVIAFHIPLFNEGGQAFRMEDRQVLFDLLKDYENCIMLSAHTHFQRQIYYKTNDGWQGKNPLHEYNVGTTSGDWYSGEINEKGVPDGTMRDGTPRGYAFLNIKGNKYGLRYKVAGKDSSYQIQIYAPKIVARDSRGRSPFYANFFMGSEKDSVQYKIDDGEWRAMEYERTFDYSYLSKLLKWDQTTTLLQGRRPSAAVPSEHVWSAFVNKSLPPGQHTIHVKAQDQFGNVYEQTHTYTIQ